MLNLGKGKETILRLIVFLIRIQILISQSFKPQDIIKQNQHLSRIYLKVRLS